MARQKRDVIAGVARLFEGQLLCRVDGSQTLTPTPRLPPRLQRCQVSRSGCDIISPILTLLTAFTPDRQPALYKPQLLYAGQQQPGNNSVVIVDK